MDAVKTVVHCRVCGQPMKQDRCLFRNIITCENLDCPMSCYTLTDDNYHAVDLTLYFDPFTWFVPVTHGEAQQLVNTYFVPGRLPAGDWHKYEGPLAPSLLALIMDKARGAFDSYILMTGASRSIALIGTFNEATR